MAGENGGNPRSSLFGRVGQTLDQGFNNANYQGERFLAWTNKKLGQMLRVFGGDSAAEYIDKAQPVMKAHAERWLEPKPAAAEPTPRVPTQLAPDIIRERQQLLQALGFDLGKSGTKGDGVDGVRGKLTVAAEEAARKMLHVPDGGDLMSALRALAGSQHTIAEGFKPLPTPREKDTFGQVAHKG